MGSCLGFGHQGSERLSEPPRGCRMLWHPDIQENVSSEKIRAVFMTAREHGSY